MLNSVTASAIMIILSFVLFFVLCMRNFGPIASAIVCAVLVGLTTQSGIVTSFFTDFLTGTMNMAKSMALMFIFGGIFGEVMNASGSTRVIGRKLIDWFGVSRAPYVLFLLNAILIYAGVNSAMVICAYVGFGLFREANLPRTLACVAVAASQPMIAATLPGAVGAPNVIPTTILGTDVYAAPLIGVTAFIVATLCIFWYLNRLMKQFQAKGIGYDPLPDEDINAKSEQQDLPGAVLAFLPLVLVIVLTLFFTKCTPLPSAAVVVLAMAIPTVMVYIFNWNRIKGNKFEIVDSGIKVTLYPLLGTCFVVGYATVVQDTAAYSALVNSIMNMNVSPYIVCVVGAALVAALCADSIGGEAAFLTAFGSSLLEKGANAAAIHRLTALSASTLNSLPHCGSVVTAIAFMRVTHKEAYRHIAIVQIIVPIIYTIVGTVLAVLFYH